MGINALIYSRQVMALNHKLSDQGYKMQIETAFVVDPKDPSKYYSMLFRKNPDSPFGYEHMFNKNCNRTLHDVIKMCIQWLTLLTTGGSRNTLRGKRQVGS